MDPEPEDPARRGDVPSWLYVFAGWLLASTLLTPPPRPPTEREMRERAPFGALDPPGVDPDRMSVRDLRRLPAIGPTRALAIARARWEQGLVGGPESWAELPGIGPGTVASVRSFLRARAERP